MIYVNMKGDTARARKCHEGIAQALTALGDDLHALRNSRYPERYEMLMLAARRIDAAVCSNGCGHYNDAVRTVSPFLDLLGEYALDEARDIRGFIPVIIDAAEDDVADAYGLQLIKQH